MFAPFLATLRAEGVPVSLREYLDFLGAVQAGCAGYDAEQFYFLARAALVKDERHLDRFDRAFSISFKGLGDIPDTAVLDALNLPEDWLRREAEKFLTPDELAEIDKAGSFEALMERLRQRLAEQKERHQGGSKWIGTGGTSPFGAYGAHPEGVRIGASEGRMGRAVKVWDRREFRDLDGDQQLGTRAMKVALKRLRNWAREGAAEELDLDATIHATAREGFLDVKTRPERRNAVKVLMFFDVGGSMDAYVSRVEALFSAAKSSFGSLEFFYFHNCLYEGVWRDNVRRWNAQTPTDELFRTYSKGYKAIFVGDATMSPYEIAARGGANEHWNDESGETWLTRAREAWPDHLWINPVDARYWPHTQSIAMIRRLFDDRMVPLTLDGLTRGMKLLA